MSSGWDANISELSSAAKWQFHDFNNLGEKMTIIVDNMIPAVAEINNSEGKNPAILKGCMRVDGGLLYQLEVGMRGE